MMQKESNSSEKERVSENEIDLRVEELEEVIAPKLATNHNETFVSDTTP
jgi:hypothetical protein